MLYLFLRRILVGPLIGMIFRPWVKGLENIPEDGPALLVSNHLAFCDSVFLPVAVPRQIHFPAKAEYFTAPGFKGKVVAAFFRAVGQVPIDRSGGRASMAALDTGIRSCPRASCSASTPRAPGRPTAGCTRAVPASPGSRSWPVSR